MLDIVSAKPDAAILIKYRIKSTADDFVRANLPNSNNCAAATQSSAIY